MDDGSNFACRRRNRKFKNKLIFGTVYDILV
jgi:hypothetical protein